MSDQNAPATDPATAATGRLGRVHARLARVSVARVLSIGIILLPLASIYSRQQTVALLIAIAVAALIAARLGKPQPARRWSGVDPLPLAAFGLFLGWAFLSLLWTVDASRSLGVALKLAGIGVTGILLVLAARRCAANDRDEVGKAALIAAYLGVGAIALEAAIDLAVIKWLWPHLGQTPPRSLVYLNYPLLVMTGLVPLAACYALVRGWWWWAAGLYAAVLLVAFHLESGTAILSLVASGAAFLVLGFAPAGLKKTAAAVALTAAIFLMPLAGNTLSTFPPALQTVQKLGDSARHRLAMWGALSEIMYRRPVIGVGIGAVRSLPDAKTIIPVPDASGNASKLRVELIPMHPHNVGLEIGIELGLVGLTLALLLVLSILRAGMRLSDRRWTMTGVAALACAVSVTGVMALSVWNYALLSGFLLVFANIAAWGRDTAPASEAP